MKNAAADGAAYDVIARLAASWCGCRAALVCIEEQGRFRVAGRHGRLDATAVGQVCATLERLPIARSAVHALQSAGGYAAIAASAGVRAAVALLPGKARVRLSPQRRRLLAGLVELTARIVVERKGLEALFRTAHIDLIVVDAEEKRIRSASVGACKQLGFDAPDLAGMPIDTLLPRFSDQRYRAALERLRRDEPVVIETVARKKDGTLFPVEIRADLVREGGRERIVAVVVDTSERDAAERELRLLRTAIEVAGDVILIYRVDPKTGRLCLAYMNDAYERQTGYTREEALGRELERFRQAMPDDPGMAEVRAALAEGRPTSVNIVSYRKDGTSFWNQVTLHPIFDANGTITHWISIERDISELVARETQLEEEHRRLIGLSEAARGIFAALDGRALVATVRERARRVLGGEVRIHAVFPDGRAVEVDDAAEVSETAAVPANALLVEAARADRHVVEAGRRRAAAVARMGGGDHKLVIELVAPAASRLREVDLFALDLFAAYLGIAARNVALYRELDEQRSAVMELNQTKSDLLAMLVHDFRGPLTAIVGFAELIEELGPLDEQRRELLDNLKRSAQQLAALAGDTLTLARLERNDVVLERGTVDLRALLEEIAASFAHRRFVSVAVEGDTRIVGDEKRLRQVFTNLVENAVKYSPDDAPVEVVICGEEQTVSVAVRDRGIGIPHDELTRIFDRFTRASNARRLGIPGTGFGLYLVKQLVRLHGGTISVDSIEHRGSTFTVTLPRTPPRNAGPATVVVLDPEGEDRSFIVQGLRDAGYRVRTAIDLDELLRTLDGLDRVDALVLDLEGVTPTAEQQARLRVSMQRGIPAIVLSSSGTGAPPGAISLAKPVFFSDLLRALEGAVLTRNESRER